MVSAARAASALLTSGAGQRAVSSSRVPPGTGVSRCAISVSGDPMRCVTARRPSASSLTTCTTAVNRSSEGRLTEHCNSPAARCGVPGTVPAQTNASGSMRRSESGAHTVAQTAPASALISVLAEACPVFFGSSKPAHTSRISAGMPSGGQGMPPSATNLRLRAHSAAVRRQYRW